MSRIFDALRQSEKDKNPDGERWSQVTEELMRQPGVEAHDGALADVQLPEPLADQLPFHVAPSPAQSGAPSWDVHGLIPPMDLPPVAEQARVPETPESAFEPPVSLLASTERVEFDLSKLKTVPVESMKAPTLVALNSERELGAEKFRVLGARLSNIRMGANIGILQVTSSVQGEGKSLVSVNLSMTLAKRFAQKVLLIEGDLRKPAACELMGLKHQLGIGEWWQDKDTPIGKYILRIGDTGMFVLPAGNVTHPASVLQSPRTADMLAEVARHFDWVIIDTPPLLPMADSNLWSRVSDATLLVVRNGAVSKSALKKAVESLDNPKLVGIVLNDANDYDQVNYYGKYNMPPGSVEQASRKANSQ